MEHNINQSNTTIMSRSSSGITSSTAGSNGGTIVLDMSEIKTNSICLFVQNQSNLDS